MIGELNYWVFLLVLVAAFWATPTAFRMPLLAAASIGYLALVDPATVTTMLVFALIAQQLYARVDDRSRRRVLGRLLIAAVLLYLGWFKYVPLLAADGAIGAADVVIPLGISYFTFKLIHYCIESGRGTLPAHGLSEVLSYAFLVPIFTAGPIERFDHFVRSRQPKWDSTLAVEGLTRIGHGLVKRFLVGTVLMMLIGKLTNGGGVVHLLTHLDTVSPPVVVAFLVLTYLYVYMDFAGYTDIALGTSRLFGLRIMENFNLPIFAPNIGNLWKRWHMTLAGWCQSYVYMPMIGVTRNPYVAVMSSFLVMGLWHGASLNWVAWGLYNAAGVMAFQTWLVIERKRKIKFMKKKPINYVGYPLTFFFFSGSFAFTTTEHIGLYSAFRLLAKCFFVTLPA